MTTALMLAAWPAATHAEPAIATHDNTTVAGTIRGESLIVRLYAGSGTWRPEGDAGPAITVQACRGLHVPGPVVRVRTGTTIDVSIRNSLDVPLDAVGDTHDFGPTPMPESARSRYPAARQRCRFERGSRFAD